jgi:AcrR family transcriptional regulator
MSARQAFTSTPLWGSSAYIFRDLKAVHGPYCAGRFVSPASAVNPKILPVPLKILTCTARSPLEGLVFRPNPLDSMSTSLRYSFGLYTLSSAPTTSRPRVLTATLDLIQRAPGPISMGAIAKAAGLSRQALYLIFEDKADLFIGLLRFVDGRRGLVEEIAKIRDARTGVDALLALVDMQARLNPGYKSVVDSIEILRRQDPAAEKAWQDRLDDRLEGARAIVGRIAAEGRLRPNLDQAIAADLIWTLMSVATWDDLVTRRGWTESEYREHLSALLLSSLVS